MPRSSTSSCRSPAPKGRDLLVEVKAVSVNPVDTKVRRSAPARSRRRAKVLGWDAAGVVAAVGRDGDPVQARRRGLLCRRRSTGPGTNAELHLVDERIVGRKPGRSTSPQAAALPLTSITAWEAAVRPPGRPPARCRGAARRRADHRRRRRRRLDRDPARPPADRAAGDRHRLAPRDARPGPASSAPTRRSTIRKPLAAEVEALGIGAAGFVVLDDQHRRSTRRDRRS